MYLVTAHVYPGRLSCFGVPYLGALSSELHASGRAPFVTAVDPYPGRRKDGLAENMMAGRFWLLDASQGLQACRVLYR